MFDLPFDLRTALNAHAPIDDKEATDRDAMLGFLASGAPCFDRTHLPGHFTGSALLISRDGARVLLNHHRALNFWLQFGGHADGSADLLDVAARELVEESGFSAFEHVMDGIFDLDIHPIPYSAKRGEPAHLHYDVRFIFRLTTDDERFTLSDESLDMRWCSYDDAIALTGPGSVARMLGKWRAIV